MQRGTVVIVASACAMLALGPALSYSATRPKNRPHTVVASSPAMLVIAESVKSAGVPCLLLARSCFSVPGSSSSGVSAARQLKPGGVTNDPSA